jgi:hypothetical protein
MAPIKGTLGVIATSFSKGNATHRTNANVNTSGGSGNGMGEVLSDYAMLIYNSDAASARIIDNSASTEVTIQLTGLGVGVQSFQSNILGHVSDAVMSGTAGNGNGANDEFVVTMSGTVDETRANAHSEWRAQGYPDLPSDSHLEELRAAQELTVLSGYPQAAPAVHVDPAPAPASAVAVATLRLDLTLPSLQQCVW